MVSDETYELCLPVLQDPSIEDEEKTDRLEQLLKEKTSLTGQALENAILDAMWRYRDGAGSATSPPPIRQTILRRPSPASWRGSPTPLSASPRLGISPLAPPGFVPTSLSRTKSSSAVSPFGSPRPSPRLAFAAPVPNSPNLNAYRFATDEEPSHEIFGDVQSDNVDWLVNDDALASTSASSAAAPAAVPPSSSGLNVAAPEFVSSQQAEMSPYDMLRSILGQSLPDDEIEAALAMHGYDVSLTLQSIMETRPQDKAGTGPLLQTEDTQGKVILIGRSMTPDIRPVTPAEQAKASVICRFFMTTGHCLRSDCRFSHDVTNHVCKYWVNGNCLAGDTCIFSHDLGLSRLNVAGGASTPPNQHAQLSLQDYAHFPALQPGTPEQAPFLLSSYPQTGITPPPGFKVLQGYPHDRPRSRPTSRHQHKDASPAAPALDDADAFPALGATTKQGKKHHAKRGGHGHHNSNKDVFTPNTLAGIVRMSPSPGPAGSPSRKLVRNASSTSIRNGENSPASQAIPNPKHIPWLETGDRCNKAYLKARQEAIKHGGQRNKFLQSAAQAWNRNDARAAKALSLRGQSENDLMRKAHREAAQQLYEERNRNAGACPEIYVDLHGLHPEEAVVYLEEVLMENGSEARPIYAITGTGHHSKNGKDKVGKALRAFLNEWRYAYREFSVPGDRSNTGGVLGIDARSWDKSLAREGAASSSPGTGDSSSGSGMAGAEDGQVDMLSQGVEIGEGKVKLLVRDPAKEPPKGPAATRPA